MTDIWFYEPSRVINGNLLYDKMLLVIDEGHVAKAKYNLTMMGVEHVNTFAELKEYVGETAYPYIK